MQYLLAALTAIESEHSWVYLLKMLTHTLQQSFLLRDENTGTVHSEEKKLAAHK